VRNLGWVGLGWVYYFYIILGSRIYPVYTDYIYGVYAYLPGAGHQYWYYVLVYKRSNEHETSL